MAEYEWDKQWGRLAFATGSYWQIIDTKSGRYHRIAFGFYWRTKNDIS